MVISRIKKSSGWFMLDMGIAISLILFAVFPLAYSFSYEQKSCRGYYFRAVATEIVDGEFERLMAGEWKKYAEGEQEILVKENALRNLPPGKFILTRQGTNLKIEWKPAKKGKGGSVAREGRI